jgi:hypothetical protein
MWKESESALCDHINTKYFILAVCSSTVKNTVQGKIRVEVFNDNNSVCACGPLLRSSGHGSWLQI